MGPETVLDRSLAGIADPQSVNLRVAIAELVSRGKEQIVIIRAYQRGLMRHGLYYHHEVRDVNQVLRAEGERVKQPELGNLLVRFN
jgi:non-homologous end joining protein Ku